MRSYQGSKIVPIRIPPPLLERIEFEVRASMHRRKAEPHTVTSWLIAAARAKLDHADRSRAPRRKRSAG